MNTLAEWDWIRFVNGELLHHMATWDQDEDWEDVPQGYGRTSCGRRGWLMIPGVFSRLGLDRCNACCDKLDYPRGKGSPKNDDACRSLVERRLKKYEESLEGVMKTGRGGTLWLVCRGCGRQVYLNNVKNMWTDKDRGTWCKRGWHEPDYDWRVEPPR